MKKYNTAILGATGAVGHEFLKLIEERDFPFDNLKLLASKRSAGTKLTVKGKAGRNTLRIAVTSTWFNRLAYDANLPEAERKTWTIAGPDAGSPLRDSGLLGPVRVLY